MGKQSPSDHQLIYGIHSLEEAILSGKEFERIYIQKEAQSEQLSALKEEIRKRRLPVHQVPIHKLNRLCRKNHQGVVAFLAIVPNVSVSEVVARAFEAGEDPRILILDRVTDVRNMGAIARSAVAFGIHGLVIPFKGSAMIHADAVKASSGALMKLPVCRVGSLRATVQDLKDSGLSVIGLTEKTDQPLSANQFDGPFALILGNEEEGISDELLQKCTTLARIPISGEIDSLNVSVAASIAMFVSLKS